MTSWFQTSAAQQLFDRHIYVVGTGCSCLGNVQGWGPSKRLIIQGGPAVLTPLDMPLTADNVLAMMHQLRAEAQRQRCVYAEIRCFDDYSPLREVFEQAGFAYRPHYDIIISLTQSLTMHESKQRAIRKALADGQTWRTATCTGDIHAFYRLLSRLYRTKVHRPIPNEAFFIRAWEQGVPVLVTEQPSAQGPRITGGVLMPVLDTTAYEWYICGGVMSTWAMIEYGRQHHLTHIDMMGAGSPGQPYGVRDFKCQMGGELHEWGRYICILQPRLYHLGEMLITKTT